MRLPTTTNSATTSCGLAMLVLCLANLAQGSTLLPLGPITFDSNAQYDGQFKESSVPVAGFPTNGLTRNGGGYLSVSNVPTSLAVFDMSATGGGGGLGGTGGSNLNNDLSNFTISADFASTLPGIAGGFLMRLSDAEIGGYLATVRNLAPFQIQFSLFESPSFTGAGFNIYNGVFNLPPPFSVAANTFYSFAVTVSGGHFHFDFAGGLVTADFIDPSVNRTSGQVGILVDTLAPGSTSRLDNFQITTVPEPSSAALALMALVVGGAAGRRVGRRDPQTRVKVS